MIELIAMIYGAVTMELQALPINTRAQRFHHRLEGQLHRILQTWDRGRARLGMQCPKV